MAVVSKLEGWDFHQANTTSCFSSIDAAAICSGGIAGGMAQKIGWGTEVPVKNLTICKHVSLPARIFTTLPYKSWYIGFELGLRVIKRTSRNLSNEAFLSGDEGGWKANISTLSLSVVLFLYSSSPPPALINACAGLLRERGLEWAGHPGALYFCHLGCGKG